MTLSFFHLLSDRRSRMDASFGSRRGPLLLVSIALFVSVPATASPAAAFDCPAAPAAAPLENMDAALVGIPVEKLGSIGVLDVMRFEVVEAVKGSIDDEAVLLVGTADAYEYSDATLTVDGARFGQEAGLQIYDESFPRVAEACTGAHPDFIRDAAQQLPQPDSSVEVEAISVGVDLGTTHRMTGEFGRIAGYVGGEEALYHARFCSDGVTLVETYRSPDGAFVRWRNMTTLEVIAEEAIPNPRPYGASIVIACGQGNRALLRTSDPYIVMDPDGTVVRTVDGDMVTGQITDIAMSDDGKSIAAIVDRQNLHVGEVEDTDNAASILDVTGRVLTNVALSPDGQQVAFLRGGDKQRMVIVGRDGTEQLVIVEPAFGQAGVINWVDAQTIATGGWAITHTSLGGETPVVTTYDLETLVDRELGYLDPPTHRTAVTTPDGPAVLDLRTGELVSLTGLRPRGIVVAAPERLSLDVDGYVPPEIEFPLPGGRVPATLEEFVEVLRENPERFSDQAAVDALASVIDATDAPEPAAADSDSEDGVAEPASFPWIMVIPLALIVLAAAVLIVRRRSGSPS